MAVPFPDTTCKIQSVVVTWQAKDGSVRETKVDLDRVAGILWRSKRKSASAPEVKSGYTHKIFGTRTIIGSVANPPKLQVLGGPNDVNCWWDDELGDWVCPEDLEP